MKKAHNYKSFLCPFEMYGHFLQLRSVFLKHLKAIALKCNQQEKKRKGRKKKKRKRGLSVEALGTEHTLHFPSGQKAYTAGLTPSILTISLYSLTAWSPSLCVLFLHFSFKYSVTSPHFRIELY